MVENEPVFESREISGRAWLSTDPLTAWVDVLSDHEAEIHVGGSTHYPLGARIVFATSGLHDMIDALQEAIDCMTDEVDDGFVVTSQTTNLDTNDETVAVTAIISRSPKRKDQ